MSRALISRYLDDNFKQSVRFWQDPAVPRVEVNLTCERCPLTTAECRERAAPPLVYRQAKRLRQKEEAVRRVLDRQA